MAEAVGTHETLIYSGFRNVRMWLLTAGDVPDGEKTSDSLQTAFRMCPEILKLRWNSNLLYAFRPAQLSDDGTRRRSFVTAD